MRRQKPSSYYHKRTREIIDANFSKWQLIRTDEREGIHRLINDVVVSVEDLVSEAKYVESKFMPDSMDIDEPWLLYRVQDVPENIFLTKNDPKSSMNRMLKEAVSLDDFIDGYFKNCIVLETISFPSSIVNKNIKSIRSSTLHKVNDFAILYGRSINTYDSSDFSITPSVLYINDTNGQEEFYTDKYSRVKTFEFNNLSSHTLKSTDDIVIKYKVIDTSNDKGYYDSAVDFDGNGVICDAEMQEFMKYYGTKMTDYTPEEWDAISWADINKDGKIDDKDLTILRNISPSLRDDVKAAIYITDTYVGKVIFGYSIKEPDPIYLYRQDSNFVYSTENSVYYSHGSKAVYDSELNIYYTLDTNTNNIRAVSSDGNNYSPLYYQATSSKAIAIDIDFTDPFLYVLVYDGEKCYLYFEEMRGSYESEISNCIEIPYLKTQGKPIAFTISHDNTFVIVYENTTLRYKFVRDVYIKSTSETQDTLFYIKRPIYDKDGNVIEPIRHYVFNSFDSFAYGIGIVRPWGCDNYKLRDLIYDFFEYPQGLDKNGVSYGIMREFGYCNQSRVSKQDVYSFPGNLTVKGKIKIQSTTIEISGDAPQKIEGIGTIVGKSSLVFDKLFLESISGQTITFYVDIDDIRGNSNTLTFELSVPELYSKEAVHVYNYKDPVFLKSKGLLVNGLPTKEFIDIIHDLEDKSEFIYKNVVPEISVFGRERIPKIPILPTIYDVDTINSTNNIEVIIE